MLKNNFFAFLLILLQPVLSFAQDADAIVKAAVEYQRENSSFVEASMTVHRPDWERTSSFKAWTIGNDKTLVVFTAPKKDAGSASLTLDDDTWSYAPKINKVIKIPPSMRNQSWMGSDFSYRDLSREDDIVKYYSHKLLETLESDGHKAYLIEALPLENAPVVWGKEVMKIRDDHILLEHTFFDQDMKPLKKLKTSEIDMLGGKLFPRLIHMEKLEEADNWTEVRYEKLEFGVEVPESMFTLGHLRTIKP